MNGWKPTYVMKFFTMEEYQKKTGDPRVNGESPWDDYPYYAGEEYLKGKYLDEVENNLDR